VYCRIEVKRYKALSLSQDPSKDFLSSILEKASKVYDAFLLQDSALQINLPHDIVLAVKTTLDDTRQWINSLDASLNSGTSGGYTPRRDILNRKLPSFIEEKSEGKFEGIEIQLGADDDDESEATNISSVDSKFGDMVQKQRNSRNKVTQSGDPQASNSSYHSKSGSADLPSSPSFEQKSVESPSRKRVSEMHSKRKISAVGGTAARFSKLFEQTSQLFGIYDASEKEILLLVAKDVFMRFKTRPGVQEMLSKLKPLKEEIEEIQIVQE
jgi:hypothetical protein